MDYYSENRKKNWIRGIMNMENELNIIPMHKYTKEELDKMDVLEVSRINKMVDRLYKEQIDI